MIYVMSDLHGEYEKYKAMLDKIQFSDEDDLYILGDVMDRGERPFSILRDMAARDNVYPILGNHELMAMDMLEKLMVHITEDNYNTYMTVDMMKALMEWQTDGGNPTMTEFRKLSVDEQMDLLDYMKDFEPYAVVDAGDKTFVLVHAGLKNFSPEKALSDYTLDELTFCRPDFEKAYFTDSSVYVVMGHTPTLAINGKAEIYKSSRNICIDCGASFPGGRLACLCLDTMEVYYV